MTCTCVCVGVCVHVRAHVLYVCVWCVTDVCYTWQTLTPTSWWLTEDLAPEMVHRCVLHHTGIPTEKWTAQTDNENKQMWLALQNGPLYHTSMGFAWFLQVCEWVIFWVSNGEFRKFWGHTHFWVAMPILVTCLHYRLTVGGASRPTQTSSSSACVCSLDCTLYHWKFDWSL